MGASYVCRDAAAAPASVRFPPIVNAIATLGLGGTTAEFELTPAALFERLLCQMRTEGAAAIPLIPPTLRHRIL